MNNKGLFLTGTGTDVGKTVTAGFLLTLLKSLQVRTLYYKPIQCGPGDWMGKSYPQGDSQVIQEVFGHEDTACTWFLRTPASPHLAFAMQNQQFDARPVQTQLIEARRTHDFVLLEGAGGVRVPLDDHQEMIDLMRICNFPVLVTASLKIGTINHTLLTLESLAHHRIPVAGFVMSGQVTPSILAQTADNAHVISKRSGVPYLGTIPDATMAFPSEALDDHPLKAFLQRLIR